MKTKKEEKIYLVKRSRILYSLLSNYNKFLERIFLKIFLL